MRTTPPIAVLWLFAGALLFVMWCESLDGFRESVSDLTTDTWENLPRFENSTINLIFEMYLRKSWMCSRKTLKYAIEIQRIQNWFQICESDWNAWSRSVLGPLMDRVMIRSEARSYIHILKWGLLASDFPQCSLVQKNLLLLCRYCQRSWVIAAMCLQMDRKCPQVHSPTFLCTALYPRWKLKWILIW